MNARFKRAASEFRSIVWLVVLSQIAACGNRGHDSSPPPPPPPVATFTVHPKYLIGSVFYVPPGPGSSVTYGVGTMLGTSVSTAGSWSNGSSAGQQIGIDGPTSIVFGNVFGGASANSVDLQDTFTGLSAPFAAPPADMINHDYDRILVFFGVNVNASVDSMGNVTWGADFSQIQSQGFLPQGYVVTVGCVRPNSSIYASSGCPTLRGLLTDPLGQFRLTSDDLANILAADPYADPATAPQTPDPTRYVLVHAFSYFVGPVHVTLTADLTNTSNAVNSRTSTYSYSVGASTSAGYDGVSLKDPTAFTWTNSSTLSNKTGSALRSITLVLEAPSTVSAPNFTLYIYLDTVYKTFMYSFAFVPPPL